MFEYRTPARVSIDPLWESGASRGADAQLTCHNISSTHRHSIDRRTLLKYSAATGAALSVGLKSPAIAQTKPIKLGYVSPLTGPLAAFAEADNFIIGNFKEAAKAGIKGGSATLPVEVVVKDSQSNPNR